MVDETPEAVAPIELPEMDTSDANDVGANVTRKEDAAIEAGNEKTEARVVEDDHVYPPLRKIISLGIALAMIILLSQIDGTVVATATPVIATDFGALDDVGWQCGASRYFVDSRTALQPTFGKIYKVFSVKWTFIVGLAIFELGSLICALSPSSVIFIIGRAMAGCGGASITAGAFTIIAYTVRLRWRPLFFGSMGIVSAISTVAGPVIGGALTQGPGWRWCFYINLPLGGATIFLTWLLLPTPRQRNVPPTLKEKLQNIDLLGAAFVMPSMIMLLMALQWGGAKFPWNNSRVIGLFVGFGITFLIFIIVEIKLGEKATIPPRIVKMRTIRFCVLFAVLMVGGLFGYLTYLPIYYQAIRGSTPLHSGFQLLPLFITMINPWGTPLSEVITSMSTGGVVTWLGHYKPPMVIGAAIYCVGAGLITTFSVDQPIWRVYGFQIIAGVGLGMCLEQTYLAAQAALSREDTPIGIALLLFGQTLAAAIFTAISQAIFINTFLKALLARLPYLNPHAVIEAGPIGVKQLVPPQDSGEVAEAFVIAFRDVARVCLAFACLGFFAVFGIEGKNIKGMDRMAALDV